MNEEEYKNQREKFVINKYLDYTEKEFEEMFSKKGAWKWILYSMVIASGVFLTIIWFMGYWWFPFLFLGSLFVVCAAMMLIYFKVKGKYHKKYLETLTEDHPAVKTLKEDFEKIDRGENLI